MCERCKGCDRVRHHLGGRDATSVTGDHVVGDKVAVFAANDDLAIIMVHTCETGVRGGFKG